MARRPGLLSSARRSNSWSAHSALSRRRWICQLVSLQACCQAERVPPSTCSPLKLKLSTCSAWGWPMTALQSRSEEHTSELQSRENLVCRLLLAKKNTELE